MSDYNAVAPTNTDQAPKFDESSQSAAFSHYSNLSAQLPIDPSTGQLVEGGVKAQAEQSFKNIEAVLKNFDHVMSDVVRITVFVTDIQDIDAVNEVFSTFFKTYVPARTNVAVNALPMGAKVQVEALVSHGVGTIPNAPQAGDLIKLTNHTSNAPSNILSSQTVAFSHYNNISAQLPIDPVTGRVVTGGIKAETAQSLKNIKAILNSIDVPMDDVVKVNIFVKNLADVEAVNEVYSTFFPDSSIARTVGYVPARTIVQAADLEMGASVQIEAVVSHGDGTPPQAIEDRHNIVIKANNTKNAPVDNLSTQTVAFSHYNHLSAQLPIDPSTGKLVEGGIQAQTKQALTNIKAVIESVDHVMEDMVKVNIFVKDLADMEAVNGVYAEFFPEGTPARRVVGVSALQEDALIQIDAIAGNAEGTLPETK